MMFGDRDVWFNHELNHHHSLNICKLCAYQCPATTLLKQHIVDQHGPYPGEELESMVEHGRIAPSHLKAQDCPFCDDWALILSRRYHNGDGRPPPSHHHQGDILVSLTHFKRHVAMHQEQLAIFTVPRTVDSDDRRSHGTDEKGLSVISSDYSNSKSTAAEEAVPVHSDTFQWLNILEQMDRMKSNDKPLAEMQGKIQAVKDHLKRTERTENTLEMRDVMHMIQYKLDRMFMKRTEERLEGLQAKLQAEVQAIIDRLDRESEFQFFPLCSSLCCGTARHPGTLEGRRCGTLPVFRGMPLCVSSCVAILLHGCWRLRVASHDYIHMQASAANFRTP